MKISNATRVSAFIAIVAVLVPGSLAQSNSSSADPGGSSGGSESGGGGASSSTDDDGSQLECEDDGSSAHFEEFFTGSGSTMVRWGGSDTGCPNHVSWEINPNPAKENPSNMSIPAYPMMFESGGTTNLSSTADHIGIMRNGVAMFSPWAEDTVVDYEDTAFYLEADTFDLCGGHATIDGTYHYHGAAGCLQEQAQLDAGTSANEHSAILGWAYDGFPIYGQLGPDGVEMKMCDLDGADATHCLNVCSGYEALIPSVDDFTYRYYTSCGFDESFFPFTTNCYRGCCPDGMTCSDKVEACGDNPVDGFTADYVPQITNDLSVQYDSQLIVGDDTDFIDSNYSVNCTLYMGEGSSTFSGSSGTAIDGDATPAPASARRDPGEVAETPSPSVIREGGGQDRPTISPALSSLSQSPMTTPTRPPTPDDTSTRPPTSGVGLGSPLTKPTPMPSSSASNSTTPTMPSSTTPSSSSSAGEGDAPTPTQSSTSAGNATDAPSTCFVSIW